MYAKEKYPKINPDDLAVLMTTQGQLESHMGLIGRGGKPGENNPYNVGEYDAGTMMTFKSPKEGVRAYVDLLAKDYLPSKDWDINKLIGNYVNNNGLRYASNPDYEKDLLSQFKFIKENFAKKFQLGGIIRQDAIRSYVPQEKIKPIPLSRSQQFN